MRNIKYLWCGIVGRTARCPQKLSIHHHVRKTKISNFHMHIVIEQQIFRLQISMHNHMTMTIVDARYNLLEETAGFVFQQFTMLDDIIEQLPSAHILHNHEDISRSRYHLIQFDDVRMPEQFQVLYLSPDFADDV